jgi:hypothetical protein
MSKNKELLNLFGFLMELLNENTNTNEEVLVTKEETKPEETQPEDELSEVLYRLQNPMMAPHPVTNPMVQYKNPLTGIAPHAVELIRKMDAIDKEHGQEVMKTRAVTKAVKPLNDYISKLKEEAHNNANEVMKDEIKDYIETKDDRVGVILEGGQIKTIKVPTELRNTMSVGEDELSPISEEMQEHLEQLSNSKLPQAIKDVLMNAKEVSEPIESPTQYIPDLSNGEIVYKPKPKAKPKAKVKPRKTKKK